jgi:hypothetical protein
MSSQTTNSPKIFTSYSWDSPEHIDRVLALSDRLRADGIDCSLDQYEVSPPEGWPRWMENQVDWAEFVLVICTEQYYQRFRGRDSQSRGVTWEGAIITQDLYDAQVKNTKFIPIVFSPLDSDHIPRILRPFTRYFLNTEEGYIQLYRHLTNQPSILKPELGNLRPLPPRERKQDFSEEAPESEPYSQEKNLDNRLNFNDSLPQQTDSRLDSFADDNTRGSREPHSEFQYQIALSFAGEDRKFAERLAELLKKKI